MSQRYPLRGAIGFLTRIPMRTPTAPDLGAAIAWFPAVGAGIGLMTGAIVAASGQILPMTVAAVIGVAAGLLITGAFHEDGLADVSDAFAGGWTRQERLEILDDPRHGTYGVAALTCSIILRVACIASLTPMTALAALVAAHTLGRGAAVASMPIGPVARGEGLGAEYLAGLRSLRVVAAIVSALAIAGLALGWWMPIVVAVIIPVVAVVMMLARTKIGGISGDVLGTIEQVAEIAALVCIAALARHHHLWFLTR
jgi:adenosylcobinamide-GDP ribazoletransferase